MAACQEGKVVVLDASTGATLGSVSVGGSGVDQIAYDAQRTRLYVPAPGMSAMSVVALGSNGVPSVLGSVDTANDAHCAVTAGAGAVFVCAPSRGALLFVKDPF
jgi:DNA-binding beta-propeller fold protein YncE